jgi:DNA-directed RNA polymerase specialized sigma24 family protein
MREERPRNGSVKKPPDLTCVRTTAHNRARRWGIYDVDATEIADKVMDSVERARRKKPQFLPDETQLRRWVSRAVQRHVLNLGRYASRHMSLEDVPELELVASGAVSIQPEEEEPDPRLAAMDAVVERTPPRWREVWALMKEGFKPKEIAPMLDIEVRTVDKYVEHLHRTLREALAGGRENPEGREP